MINISEFISRSDNDTFAFFQLATRFVIDPVNLIYLSDIELLSNNF